MNPKFLLTSMLILASIDAVAAPPDGYTHAATSNDGKKWYINLNTLTVRGLYNGTLKELRIGLTPTSDANLFDAYYEERGNAGFVKLAARCKEPGLLLGIQPVGTALAHDAGVLHPIGSPGYNIWKLACESPAIVGEDSGRYAYGMRMRSDAIQAYREKRFPEAIKNLRLAAENGNDQAQNELAAELNKGEIVKQDFSEALRWWRVSADHGNAYAQNSVGIAYANGLGVDKDEREAVKWHRKAAEQGNASGQYSLGFDFANGIGVQKNFGEAAKWYRKAADQGYAPAQDNLGDLYENGNGTVKDYGEALKWYRLSADQGNSYAQVDLGAMYENGNGVEQDLAEATKWYRRAADQGNIKGVEALKRLRAN